MPRATNAELLSEIAAVRELLDDVTRGQRDLLGRLAVLEARVGVTNERLGELQARAAQPSLLRRLAQAVAPTTAGPGGPPPLSTTDGPTFLRGAPPEERF